MESPNPNLPKLFSGYVLGYDGSGVLLGFFIYPPWFVQCHYDWYSVTTIGTVPLRLVQCHYDWYSASLIGTVPLRLAPYSPSLIGTVPLRLVQCKGTLVWSLQCTKSLCVDQCHWTHN